MHALSVDCCCSSDFFKCLCFGRKSEEKNDNKSNVVEKSVNTEDKEIKNYIDKVVSPRKEDIIKKICEEISNEEQEEFRKIIQTDDILKALNIKDALQEISKLTTREEKIKKIIELSNKDINRKVDVWPRTFVIREKHDCFLVSLFVFLLNDPVSLKFFYLLLHSEIVNEVQTPFLCSVCKIIDYAILNPNFCDETSVLKVLEEEYKYINLKKLKSLSQSEYKEMKFGKYQINTYTVSAICEIINIELGLNTLVLDTFSIFPCSFDDDYYCHNNYNTIELSDFVDSIKCNLKSAFYKSEVWLDTCIRVELSDYHFFSIRRIGNKFFSYDSLKYEKPTEISTKSVVELFFHYFFKLKYEGYKLTLCKSGFKLR